jgi:hypothetical protein
MNPEFRTARDVPRNAIGRLAAQDPKLFAIAGVFSPKNGRVPWLFTASKGQLTNAMLFIEFPPIAGG